MVEMAEEGKEIGSAFDVTRRIHEYKERGEDVSAITFQRTPVGLYSQEVAAFLGRLFIAGRLILTSPVTFSKGSLQWLKNFVEEKA